MSEAGWRCDSGALPCLLPHLGKPLSKTASEPAKAAAASITRGKLAHLFRFREDSSAAAAATTAAATRRLLSNPGFGGYLRG